MPSPAYSPGSDSLVLIEAGGFYPKIYGVSSVAKIMVNSQSLLQFCCFICTDVITTSEDGAPAVTSSTQTEVSGRQLLSLRLLDNDALHYYTGLETAEKFIFVLSTLGPAVHSLVYYYNTIPPLTVEDQFLLTLIKLRTHPTNKELSFLFGVNEKLVSNVFITWINFMYCQWTEIDWWPSRELVRYYTPSHFSQKFPKTRVILDGTEFPIKRPKQPVVQQATFSTYKNRNTMKVLVGISPGGLVSYVSEAYGGSTSDRQTVERSNLVNKCDPGDEIMADKGFNVDDLFLPYQIAVNIPTFFRKRNRMTAETVTRDRKISSKRVHVERAIGLAKTYKIMRDPMNSLESTLSTQISTVCFLLCNFRRCIM